MAPALIFHRELVRPRELALPRVVVVLFNDGLHHVPVAPSPLAWEGTGACERQDASRWAEALCRGSHSACTPLGKPNLILGAREAGGFC